MRAPESGFTLVEVLIALVLFSMIGLAGFSLLNAMIGVEARTDRRLDRLAELQRAMHVLTLDFEQQLADRPIAVEGSRVRLSRSGGSQGAAVVVVEYDLKDRALRRFFAGASGASENGQVLLSEVDALRWEFFGRSTGWVETWPPAGMNGPASPQAIAAVLTVAGGGLSGVLRRVIRLPEAVDP